MRVVRTLVAALLTSMPPVKQKSSRTTRIENILSMQQSKVWVGAIIVQVCTSEPWVASHLRLTAFICDRGCLGLYCWIYQRSSGYIF